MYVYVQNYTDVTGQCDYYREVAHNIQLLLYMFIVYIHVPATFHENIILVSYCIKLHDL